MPLAFGSAWSYAGSLEAVGQLSASELVHEWRFRTVDSDTRLYGVVGRPVAHSLSPALHNAAFAAAGINALYLPFPAADIDDFASFARAFGVAGASVTVPFKVEMLQRVDVLSPTAHSIGAVNTLRVEDGRWIGENTDAAGFLAPLSGRVTLDGLRVSILGGGGAALAVASALRGRAASVAVHARNHAQAESVARRTAAAIGPWPPEAGTWDLLVNCTPVGMTPGVDQSPVPASVLTGRYVYDLVYNPPRTRLLRDAAAAGCTTIGGIDMLIAQAEEQFRCWTGRSAPAGVMRRAAGRRLAEWEPDENHVV
jgi:shikimate dehydrogenase